MKALSKQEIFEDNLWWVNQVDCCKRFSTCLSSLSSLVRFSIDGVFLKNSAGCGGVLKNQNGKIKAIFSGPVNCVGLDFSRLSAIKSAMEIFIEAD
ncbi:hypothetical protein GQ457_17G018770 [Hibiscus cannabinus]